MKPPRPGVHGIPCAKCLTWNLFLPDNLSYQDFQQQPLLLTVAYARALQYWAEELRPLAHPDFYPLAMSILELMEIVKEHIIFSKWNVIWGLGRISPGTMNWWPQPTITSIRGTWPTTVETQETGGTTPSLFGPSPSRGNAMAHLTKSKADAS